VRRDTLVLIKDISEGVSASTRYQIGRTKAPPEVYVPGAGWECWVGYLLHD